MCSPAIDEKPPRPRRWIPLSLRMFLVIVVLAGIASALWVGGPAYRQWVAIREIDGLGGSVETIPVGPTWLRDLAGERMRMVDEVNSVILDDSRVNDATVANLKTLRSLRFLDLRGTKVTDAGLVHLAKLTALETLLVDETAVTDDGLLYLQDLKNLKVLSLTGTLVTDAGLRHLTKLDKLAVLSVTRTRVTYAAVRNLERDMPELTTFMRY